MALLFVGIANDNAQNKDKMEKQNVQNILQHFFAAVDSQDATTAEKYLHDNFRVVLNNHNNSGAVTILTKEQYVGMMKAGKVGGDKRFIEFLLTDVHEAAAMVKVNLDGSKNIFTNYYSLVKTNEEWLIINDLPQITGKIKNPERGN
jgi:hypothetical protein